NISTNTVINTLSLHDALPIYCREKAKGKSFLRSRSTHGCPTYQCRENRVPRGLHGKPHAREPGHSRSGRCSTRGKLSFFRSQSQDRKSTRLNSSHGSISYAVF